MYHLIDVCTCAYHLIDVCMHGSAARERRKNKILNNKNKMMKPLPKSKDSPLSCAIISDATNLIFTNEYSLESPSIERIKSLDS